MRVQRQLARKEFVKIRGFSIAASSYVEFLGILSLEKTDLCFQQRSAWSL